MKVSVFCSAILATLLFTSALDAANLAASCPTPNSPLSAYLATTSINDVAIPFSCSVGILNFTDFSFSASGDLTDPLGASEIEVTPQPSGAMGGGFSFSAEDPTNRPFAVGPNQTETYDIDYLMVIDPAPVGASADLGMDPPFGSVTITEAYCPDGNRDGRNFCSTGFQSLMVSAPPCTDPVTIIACTTSINFNPQIQNFAWIETTIVLTGGSLSGAGFDSLTGTTNIVDADAPEPASALMLLGGGLLALIARRQRVA